MADDSIVPAVSTGILKLIDVGVGYTVLVLALIVCLYVINKLVDALKVSNQRFIDLVVNNNNVLTELKIVVSAAIKN